MHMLIYTGARILVPSGTYLVVSAHTLFHGSCQAGTM